MFIFQPVFKILFCIKRDKRENQSLVLCEGCEEAGWPAWVPRKLQTIMGRNLPPSPPLHLFLITWSGTRWSTDKSNYFAISFICWSPVCVIFWGIAYQVSSQFKRLHFSLLCMQLCWLKSRRTFFVWVLCHLTTRLMPENLSHLKKKIALYHSINTLGALVPVHRLPGQQEWKSFRVFPLTSTWWRSPWNIRRPSLETMCWFILYSVLNCLSRQWRHYNSKTNQTRSRGFPLLLSKGYCLFKQILKKPAVKKSKPRVLSHFRTRVETCSASRHVYLWIMICENEACVRAETWQE